MKDSAFLIFNKSGISRLVKGRHSRHQPHQRPALDAGEYAVLVSVSVPDQIFKPRAIPEATITVPDAAVIEPRVDVAIETFSGEHAQ